MLLVFWEKTEEEDTVERQDEGLKKTWRIEGRREVSQQNKKEEKEVEREVKPEVLSGRRGVK